MERLREERIRRFEDTQERTDVKSLVKELIGMFKDMQERNGSEKNGVDN